MKIEPLDLNDSSTYNEKNQAIKINELVEAANLLLVEMHLDGDTDQIEN